MGSDDVATKNLGVLTEIDPQPEPPVDVHDVPLSEESERYQPMGTIGKGGMGEVRLYKDTRIARPVAVKVLRKEFRDQPDFRSRFLLEARLQGQLEHPSIVPVHDLGELADGELFFSMKSIRGVTLRQALRSVQAGERHAKYTRRRLLGAFSSVCLTIDYAHSRGVVHRDIKPDNVMLGDFGEIYVLDWGIAKVLGDPETPVEMSVELPTGSGTPTRAGSVMGTPRYMAPEHREGNATARSDVYSLGVILTEILEADATAEIPPELAAVAAKATAHDQSRRTATPRELHDAIEKYLDGDRDLELRRRQAEEHARAAESALQRANIVPAARSEAGHEIGRALGLDPSNTRAVRTLMRLLTDVPATLPPAARVEAERQWQERRRRTLRSATILTMSAIAFLPFILWMGVRDARLVATFVALTLASGGMQWFAAQTSKTLPFATALVLTMASLGVMTTSIGLVGVVPAGFAIVTMAWRMSVDRSTHGTLIFVAASVAICLPFALAHAGLVDSPYSVAGNNLIVHPRMHDFPPVATELSIVFGTLGAMVAALLFGRVYGSEIRRAEQRLTFHAWQLQQLVPPERPTPQPT